MRYISTWMGDLRLTLLDQNTFQLCSPYVLTWICGSCFWFRGCICKGLLAFVLKEYSERAVHQYEFGSTFLSFFIEIVHCYIPTFTWYSAYVCEIYHWACFLYFCGRALNTTPVGYFYYCVSINQLKLKQARDVVDTLSWPWSFGICFKPRC